MNVSSEAQLVLKVVLNGDVRRLKSCDLLSERAIRMAVSHLYNITPSEARCLRIFYTDDEGDLCTLTEATISDALEFANNSGKVLRLQCFQGKSSRPPNETLLNLPGEAPMECNEERDEPRTHAHLPMKGSFAQAARTMVAEVHNHVSQQVGATRSVATEARNAILEATSSLLDKVMQTVDEAIAAGLGAEVNLSEPSQDVSDLLSHGLMELQAATSDVREHLSTSLRRFVTVADTALSGRSKMYAVATSSPDDMHNSCDLAALKFADKIQVHFCDLMFGARAMAVSVRAKARYAYDQASEMDVKSALAFSALAALPAVAISTAHTRSFVLAVVAATAIGSANLVSNASPSSDESSLQLGTTNAKVHPGETIVTCDVPQESSVEIGFVYVELHPGATEVACDMAGEDMDGWCKC